MFWRYPCISKRQENTSVYQYSHTPIVIPKNAETATLHNNKNNNKQSETHDTPICEM